MLDLKNFKAVIFDFGGVIIDIDYHKTKQSLLNLLGEGMQSQFSQANQSEIFDQIETGSITESFFRDQIRNISLRGELTDGEIDQAWNAMLGSISPHKFIFLQGLAKHLPIFLLSNTNSIHLRAIEPTMADVAGSREQFEAVFTKVYYSHLMGMRKPNPEIFEQVIQENNLHPGSTLFIDDSIQHIEGASRLGLKTHHLVEDVTKIWR